MKTSPWAISPSSNCEKALESLSKSQSQAKTHRTTGEDGDDEENCCSNIHSTAQQFGAMLKQVDWHEIISPLEVRGCRGGGGGGGSQAGPTALMLKRDHYTCHSPSSCEKARPSDSISNPCGDEHPVEESFQAYSEADYKVLPPICSLPAPMSQSSETEDYGDDSAQAKADHPYPSAPSPLSETQSIISETIGRLDLPTPQISSFQGGDSADTSPLQRGVAGVWSANKSGRPPPFSPSAKKWLASARGDFYSNSPRAKLASLHFKTAQSPNQSLLPFDSSCVSSKSTNAPCKSHQNGGAFATDAIAKISQPPPAHSLLPKVLSVRHDTARAKSMKQVRPILPIPEEVVDGQPFRSVPLVVAGARQDTLSRMASLPARFTASGGPGGLRVVGLVGDCAGPYTLGLEGALGELSNRMVEAETLLGNVWVLCGQKEQATQHRDYAMADGLRGELELEREKAETFVEELLNHLHVAEADAVLAEDFKTADAIKEGAERILCLVAGSMERSEASVVRGHESFGHEWRLFSGHESFHESTLGFRASGWHCTAFFWNLLLQNWTTLLAWMSETKEVSMPSFVALVAAIYLRASNGACFPYMERALGYCMQWVFSGSIGHIFDDTSFGIVMTSGCQTISANEHDIVSLLLPNILHGIGRISVDFLVYTLVLCSFPKCSQSLAKSLGLEKLAASFNLFGKRAESTSVVSTSLLLPTKSRQSVSRLSALSRAAWAMVPSKTSGLLHVISLVVMFEALGAWSLALGCIAAYCKVNWRTFALGVPLARLLLVAPWQALASFILFGREAQAQITSAVVFGAQHLDHSVLGPSSFDGDHGPFTRMVESADWGLHQGLLNVCSGGPPLVRVPAWTIWRMLRTAIEGASVMKGVIGALSLVIVAVAIHGYAVQDAGQRFQTAAQSKSKESKQQRSSTKRMVPAKASGGIAV